MTYADRISKKFAEIKESKGKALITFITAGDPNLALTVELVHTLEKAGADIIELGVPYSDPLADGPIIQQASQRALKSGTNLRKILQTVSQLRQDTQIPIILMTYYNPLLKYGLGEIANDAFIAGVDGFIVPDLPMEEAQEFKALLNVRNIALIPLVAPTSGVERIKAITADTKGFVYCVSLTGVTGVREGLPENLKEFMEIVRQCTDAPLAVGFGISTPHQAAAVSDYCDAVIIGSALVKLISEKIGSDDLNNSVFSFVKSLKNELQLSCQVLTAGR
jgi:tryptophan synthase alpha chain